MSPNPEVLRQLPENREAQRGVETNINAIRSRTLGGMLAVLQAERMTVDGQTIESIDLPPEGREQSPGVPLVIVPGWTDSSPSLAPMITDFSRRGRRVISVCNPHGIDVPDVPGYPAPQLRKAMALIRCLEAKGVTQVDAIGHSEGAVVSTIAAHLRPGLFRNLTLYNPAGLMKRENIFRLAAGAYKDTRARKSFFRTLGRQRALSDFQRDYNVYAGRERTKNMRKGLLKTLKEVVSLSRVNTAPQLLSIQNGLRGPATHVSVVTSNDDKIYPLGRTEWADISARTGIPIHRFHSIRGTHIAHLHDDQEVTNALERSLVLMDAERQRGVVEASPSTRAA